MSAAASETIESAERRVLVSAISYVRYFGPSDELREAVEQYLATTDHLFAEGDARRAGQPLVDQRDASLIAAPTRPCDADMQCPTHSRSTEESGR